MLLTLYLLNRKFCYSACVILDVSVHCRRKLPRLSILNSRRLLNDFFGILSLSSTNINELREELFWILARLCIPFIRLFPLVKRLFEGVLPFNASNGCVIVGRNRLFFVWLCCERGVADDHPLLSLIIILQADFDLDVVRWDRWPLWRLFWCQGWPFTEECIWPY